MRGLLFSSGIIKACIWGAKVELGVGEVTGNITNNGEPLNTREQSQQPTLWLLHASQGVGQEPPPQLESATGHWREAVRQHSGFYFLILLYNRSVAQSSSW